MNRIYLLICNQVLDKGNCQETQKIGYSVTVVAIFAVVDKSVTIPKPSGY